VHDPFIPRSQNKSDGTPNNLEHRLAPFVVGAGNAITRRYPMSNRYLMSAAVAALIATTGFANAQGAAGGREAAPAAGATTQSAPPSAAPSAATPMNREGAADSKGSDQGMKSTQSDEKMAPGGAKNQRAQDAAPGQKSKSMSSDEKAGASKDMNRAEDRNGNMNRADDRDGAAKSTTTGQAGAGGKLSTEQRTKITTVIHQQNVRPVTNVNFSISVGTRVPRDVGFHPLPAEIVTIYPDWRGYEFFLVNEQVIVVNPRTLEIVAVIDA
jgi:hypothetical protein